MNNDGFNYTSNPTVSISTSPSTLNLSDAKAVAFTTERAGMKSVEKILLTNAGFGYTVAPTITITGGGGTGAAATCSINTSSNGIVRFNITENGVGFGTAPIVNIPIPNAGVASDRAVGLASIGVDDVSGFNEVKEIFVINPGAAYTTAPLITIDNPETISGIGTYHFNEVVQGMRSGTQARVKKWDADTGILQVGNVGIGTTTTGFFAGEDLKGLTSGALFSVSVFDDKNSNDKYNEGDIFESEADLLIDFTESNPFGSF